MRCISVSRVMHAPQQAVLQLFWDIQVWNKIWNPIESVTVISDDGRVQEFAMEVWREGVCEHVRTTRVNRDSYIEFRSDTPPPMMQYHAGRWNFIDKGDHTEVEAVRYFIMNDEFSESKAEEFESGFLKRVDSILEKFQQHFLAPQVHSSS